MASLRFYLQSKVKSGRLVPIYARLTNGNQRLVVRTPFYIYPDQWSQKRQMLKYTSVPVATVLTGDDDAEQLVKRKARESSDSMNAKLKQLKANVETTFALQYNKENLPKGWLKSVVYPGQADKLSLFGFFQNFIDKAATRPSPKTGNVVCYKQRREYARTLHYLQKFCHAKRGGVPLDFKDITLDFYHDFVEFLQSIGLAKNTIGKKIQTFKIVLNAATDEGLNTNLQYRSHRFAVHKEESDHFHLTETEIRAMYNLDLSGNKRLESVRDLFIVGCWTGLRFSDWHKIRPENIIKAEGYKLLLVKQSKTGGEIYIPFHSMADAIMQKYDGNLPEPISNQKTNQYLKEVAEMAGIDEYFSKTITKGGVERTVRYRKYELIGTHTARRSFATNLYNAGVPSLTIMQVTGHKTESAFLKYIKVTPKDHALKLARIWHKDNTKVIPLTG